MSGYGVKSNRIKKVNSGVRLDMPPIIYYSITIKSKGNEEEEYPVTAGREKDRLLKGFSG